MRYLQSAACKGCQQLGKNFFHLLLSKLEACLHVHKVMIHAPLLKCKFQCMYRLTHGFLGCTGNIPEVDTVYSLYTPVARMCSNAFCLGELSAQCGSVVMTKRWRQSPIEREQGEM